MIVVGKEVTETHIAAAVGRMKRGDVFVREQITAELEAAGFGLHARAAASAIIQRERRAGRITKDGSRYWRWAGDSKVVTWRRSADTNAAYEAGRKAGLEEAAQVCCGIEAKKWQMIKNGGRMHGISAADCAVAIRERIKA